MAASFNMTGILEWATERWEKRTTIVLVIAMLALALFWKFTNTDITDLSPGEILFILVTSGVVYGIWHLTVRLPRCSRNHVGVAVAIVADSKDEHKLMASDFIGTLRRLLSRGNASHNFYLIEIPQHYATRINTLEDATRLRQRCRCHFMIWGTAKLRIIDGKEKHVMNLEGIVSHAVLPERLHKQFSVEFSELFPRNIFVNRENDVLSLEFTSEWIDCVARYIIGIAAALSGDVIYAKGLFESVLENPKLKDCPIPAIRKIRQRTPVRLGEIHALLGSISYNQWRKYQDPKLLIDIRNHVAALARFDPSNYRGRLLRAIYHFIAERNVDAAENEVRKCRDIRDGTWRYSYAFLLAYKGEMQKARRMYRSAFVHDYSASAICEIEEFIERVISEEPGKAQLHFCLGLINWHGKEDKVQAVRDFEAFLAKPNSSDFPEEQKLARDYIQTLNGEIVKDQRNGNVPDSGTDKVPTDPVSI